MNFAALLAYALHESAYQRSIQRWSESADIDVVTVLEQKRLCDTFSMDGTLLMNDRP